MSYLHLKQDQQIVYFMKMQQTGLLDLPQPLQWDFVQNRTASIYITMRKLQLISQVILNQSFGAITIQGGWRDCVIFLLMDQYWEKQVLFLSQSLEMMVTIIVSMKTNSLS